MIEIQQDFTVAGAFTVRSDNPALLAAVPDVLVRELHDPVDVLACWALHPSEQDSTRDVAYVNERRLLGINAQVDVIELTRPRQRNVVWIDRYHLVAAGAPLTVAGPLLGLYVTTHGRIHLYAYPPSSGHAIAQRITATANGPSADWDVLPNEPMARWTLTWTPNAGGAVHVRVPAPEAGRIASALASLSAS